MALPPSDISPSSLWAQITEMPRPSVVVDFPRKGKEGTPMGQVRIRVLTQEEQLLCSAEAERYTKKAIKDLPKEGEAKTGYDNTYNNAAAVEVLFHAVRCEDDAEQPFFPSRAHLRQYLTPDEVGVLMVHYYTTQTQLGPIVASLTQDEMDAWIYRLGEGGQRFPLDLLSWEGLKDLAFSLACQIHAFRTGSPSVGTPPETPQPEQLSLPESPAP